MVLLFIILFKVVLTLESLDKILKCDHSNEAAVQYFPVVLFIMLNKVVLTVEPVDEIPIFIQMKAYLFFYAASFLIL